jgi:hypothetical protein
MSDKPVDLSKRRAALAEARANKLMALRTHVDNMLECCAILADAIEQMWDAGADPSEIVQTLRWAVERIEAANEGQMFRAASDEAQAGDTPG